MYELPFAGRGGSPCPQQSKEQKTLYVMDLVKQPYKAPTLTAVTFKLEKGFSTSMVMQTLTLDIFPIENDEHYVESRTGGGYWGGNDWENHWND